MKQKKKNFKKISEFFLQQVDIDIRYDSKPELSPHNKMDPPLLLADDQKNGDILVVDR